MPIVEGWRIFQRGEDPQVCPGVSNRSEYRDVHSEIQMRKSMGRQEELRTACQQKRRYISGGSTMCKRYRPRTPRSADPSSLSVTLLEFLLFGRCTPEIYVVTVRVGTRVCTRTDPDTRNPVERIVYVRLPKLSELLPGIAILQRHS